MNNLLIAEIKLMTDKYDGWGDRVGGFTKEIIEICEHYADQLKLDAVEVFKAIDSKRNYSYPNYWQWGKFPKLDDKVFRYKNLEELKSKIDSSKGFRCPNCKGISSDPYECNSGIKMSKGKLCDWKSYGLFGTMGAGFRAVLTETFLENPFVHESFYPVCLE